MNKYAVIVADLNGSGLGQIISEHRSEDAADKRLPDVPGAYISSRKADGEWETRLEARDRRCGYTA